MLGDPKCITYDGFLKVQPSVRLVLTRFGRRIWDRRVCTKH